MRLLEVCEREEFYVLRVSSELGTFEEYFVQTSKEWDENTKTKDQFVKVLRIRKNNVSIESFVENSWNFLEEPNHSVYFLNFLFQKFCLQNEFI